MPLSHKALGEHCERLGIPAPHPLRKTPRCSSWEEEYGAKHQFIRDMRDYRRCNSLLKKYQVLKSGIRNGWLSYELKFSARTRAAWLVVAASNAWSHAARPLLFDADMHIIEDKSAAAYSVFMRGRIKAPRGGTSLVSTTTPRSRPASRRGSLGIPRWTWCVRASPVYEVPAAQVGGLDRGGLPQERQPGPLPRSTNPEPSVWALGWVGRGILNTLHGADGQRHLRAGLQERGLG